MHTTIVFAHPWHGSFNKAILDTVTATLEKAGKEYVLLDLNKDGFDPVMTERDLAGFSRGDAACDLTCQYQKVLTTTDELIFIFPVWWFAPPAILKGFIDKVMLVDFAYRKKGYQMIGLLTHIKRAVVISTSEAPAIYFRMFCGNPIGQSFTKNTLKCIGVKRTKWINNDFTASGSLKSRERFLQKVRRAVQK